MAQNSNEPLVSEQTAQKIAGNSQLSLSQKAEALEREMMKALGDKIIGRSAMCQYGQPQPAMLVVPEGKTLLQGHDPRLPRLPEKPTLVDFFDKRFRAVFHLLQSANLALKAGLDEEIILACLLHDISVCGFINVDHGYFGAQLIEPYVSERVSWAVRYHQPLRFFPDSSVGYDYPEAYIQYFGVDYKPEPYIYRDYEYARNHKWYMAARQICLNDVYSFDPDAVVTIEPFLDIIGRHFKQPEEGLGFDNSPVAHMWRAMIFPNNFL